MTAITRKLERLEVAERLLQRAVAQEDAWFHDVRKFLGPEPTPLMMCDHGRPGGIACPHCHGFATTPTDDPPDYCPRCGLSTLNECACNDVEVSEEDQAEARRILIQEDDARGERQVASLIAEVRSCRTRIEELESEQELIDRDRTRLEERIVDLRATCDQLREANERLRAEVEEWAEKDGNSPGYNLEKAKNYGRQAAEWKTRAEVAEADNDKLRVALDVYRYIEDWPNSEEACAGGFWCTVAITREQAEAARIALDSSPGSSS